ncbi:MAG: radical SAM protein [Candidatus Omnitrophota bacterium]|jgi:MoaA/NifB/PqqE/SkfB family radical SAM enzyme
MDIKYILSKIKENGIRGSIRKISNRYSAFPKSINVEIMTVCNLKCKHCRVTYHGSLIPDVKPGMMELDHFKKIVDRIPSLIRKTVTFQFSSIEPLFHKDLFAMMDYVSGYNRHISFPILTNGMLLNEKNVEGLCSRNVPSVTVSLDGCRKETVESFKTGSDFDRVTGNIRSAREGSKGKFLLNTIFVATASNINELVEYVDFCSGLGIDTIFVNGFLSYKQESSRLSLFSKAGNPEVYGIFLKANERARESGIKIQFPFLTAKPRGCDAHSNMYIGENGEVAACMHLARRTPLVLFSDSKINPPVIYGNVFEEDPERIWNKREFSDFRNRHKRGEVPDECAFCGEAYGVIVSNFSAINKKDESM